MKNLQFLILLVLFISCKVETDEIPINLDSLDWIPDREDVQAGALMVPENHDDPDGKKIQITYVVLKAKDTLSSEFPMIYFSGGPGGNTVTPGFVNFLIDQPVRDNRDIILFDQRGIGYSSALPDMSFASFDIMAKDANVEEELELTIAMLAEYKKKCEEQNVSPEYYNTMQNAKDVGMLFDHLGYQQYNLMGGSYGTRLARVVQDMFPKYIHSSVLDSPAPLSGDFLLNRLDSYSIALDRIFNYCEITPECNSKYPNLKDDYFKAISKLESEPLHVSMNDSLNVVINAQDGIYLLRRLLYQTNARESAPELIQAFLNGGGEVINKVIEFENQLTGGLNLTMLLSVEKYENFNPDNTAELIKAHYENYPLVPVKLGFFDAFYQAGMDWHSNSLPMNERAFQESAIPTLIFVNQFDPVTPPKNGHLFKEQLSNGTLLVLDEGGHGGGNPQCKNRVINDFMNNPTLELDLSCLHLYEQ